MTGGLAKQNSWAFGTCEIAHLRYGKLAIWQRNDQKRVIYIMRAVSCCLLAFVFPFGPIVNAGQRIDVILRNGNIYTVNDRQPLAEAIGIKDRRIVFVGSNN